MTTSDTTTTAPEELTPRDDLCGTIDVGSPKLLWATAGACLVILFGLLPFVDNGYIALPDEGLYAAQAQNLAGGSWRSPRPAPDIDEDGVLDALGPGDSYATTNLPYASHPLYPIILTPGFKFLGTVGVLAVSVLAVWGAALCSAFLARRFNPRYGIPALLLTAIGSPMVFSAYVVMAHSLAAAAAAAMLLALSVAIDDRRWTLVAPALMAAVALVLVRSEGLIVVAAAGGTVGLMALPTPRRRAINWPAAATGTAVLAAGAVAFFLEGLWVAHLRGLDGPPDAIQAASDRSGPGSAAWISLLRPWDSGVQAKAQVLLLVVAILLGAVALRFMPAMPLITLAMWTMAAASGMALALSEPTLVTGLVPAFPLLLIPLFHTRWSDLHDPMFIRLVGTSLVAGAVIVFTVYADGGSAQWGGRFFHVTIPLLVPVVVLTVANGVRTLSIPQARYAVACLAVVSLTLSVAAIRVNLSFRSWAHDVVSTASRSVESWSGGRQIVVVGRHQGDGTSRAFWDLRNDVEVVSSGGLPLVVPLITDLSTTDTQRVLVVSDIDGDGLSTLGEDAFGRIEWTVVSDNPIGDTGLHLLDVQPQSP